MRDLHELLARVEGATEWRAVPGWPYEASDTGVLRSSRTNRHLRPAVSHKGYEKVTFQVDGVRKDVRVHRAVYAAWHGEIPVGLEINHLDGNKRNNAPANLEACTTIENVQHALRLGLMATGDRNGARTHPSKLARGSKVGTARLTEEQVGAIKASLRAGETLNALASAYGVDKTTISMIKRQRTWSHVS